MGCVAALKNPENVHLTKKLAGRLQKPVDVDKEQFWGLQRECRLFVVRGWESKRDFTCASAEIQLAFVFTTSCLAVKTLNLDGNFADTHGSRNIKSRILLLSQITLGSQPFEREILAVGIFELDL